MCVKPNKKKILAQKNINAREPYTNEISLDVSSLVQVQGQKKEIFINFVSLIHFSTGILFFNVLIM